MASRYREIPCLLHKGPSSFPSGWINYFDLYCHVFRRAFRGEETTRSFVTCITARRIRKRSTYGLRTTLALAHFVGPVHLLALLARAWKTTRVTFTAIQICSNGIHGARQICVPHDNFCVWKNVVCFYHFECLFTVLVRFWWHFEKFHVAKTFGMFFYLKT